MNTLGGFRPVPFGAFVLRQGVSPPKDRFVRAYVNAKIALGCGIKQASQDCLEEAALAPFGPWSSSFTVRA